MSVETIEAPTMLWSVPLLALRAAALWLVARWRLNTVGWSPLWAWCAAGQGILGTHALHLGILVVACSAVPAAAQLIYFFFAIALAVSPKAPA